MRRRTYLVGLAMAAVVVGAQSAVALDTPRYASPTVHLADSSDFGGGTDVISFSTTSGGALVAGSTITVTAPLGTDFFYDSTLFRIQAAGGESLPPAGLSIATTGPAATANSVYANQVTLILAQAIPAATQVTVTATGVTNPGPGIYEMSVATSAQPATDSAPYRINGSGRATWSTYADPAGTRAYMLYQPSDWKRTDALIVELPGCTETSSVEARWSRLPALAAARGFTLLVPEQDAGDNGAECWNWFEPANWSRGAGEPAILADLTAWVVSSQGIDPRRVYVSGISAGGIMANIMGVTYPDLYNGVGIYAGCEYEGLPCFAAPAAQPPEASAMAALTEMAGRNHQMPVIVINGDADELVPAVNATDAVQQWLYTNAVAGGATQPVWPKPPTSAIAYDQPGKQPATIYRWSGSGSAPVEHLVVPEMAHQWSDSTDIGTPEDALITDPDGPDVTTPLVDFFLGPPRNTGRS